MKVYNDIHHLPQFQNAVLTIGTFDGVHRGHKQILVQLQQEAHQVNGTAVVITFYPHPKQIIESGKDPLYLLTTPAEKYRLLAEAGIEHIVEVPFTREFSEQPPGNYITDFLVNKFHPHTIIIGYDHRFGKNREGDFRLLEALSKQYDYTVKEIPEHVLKNVTVSSTRIRQALVSGEVDVANDYLGYAYFFHAYVVHGDRIGHSIGYPTANLALDHERKLLPADGVYAVKAEIEGTGIFKGMMNIGFRPTVKGKSHVTEVHLFDFDKDIYGSSLTISVIKKIRDEVKFDGLPALQEQLNKDKIAALQIL